MTLEAPTEYTEFISSQTTVSSETYARVISLGEALVEEMRLNPGVDTLSRWMAHHVAAQIELANSASDDERATAQKACFDTILKLWKHRSYYPGNLRPFENFEAIFRVIERLDPDSKSAYFYRPQDVDLDENDVIQEWLELAAMIDRVAKLWLSHVLQQASQEAATERVQHWLSYSTALSLDGADANESTVIEVLLNLLDKPEPETESEEERRRRWLQERLAELDAMMAIHDQLRESLSAELNSLDDATAE